MENPVSAAQLAVLKWIADGCDSSTIPSLSYKIHAVALQNRGLIYLAHRRGHWNASLTAKGEYYIEHGQYPDPPAKTERPLTRSERKNSLRRAARRREAAARRREAVPKPRAIPIPTQVSDAHPAIRELMEHKRRLAVPEEHRQRALLILQALIEEAQRRGWTVAPTASSVSREARNDGHTRIWESRDLFSIDAGHYAVGIRLRVRHRQVLREPSDDQEKSAKRWGYNITPSYDLVPTDEIFMDLDDNQYPSLIIKDTPVFKVEDKLIRAINRIQDATDKALVYAEERRVAAMAEAEAQKRREAFQERVDRYGTWVKALETLHAEMQHHDALMRTVARLREYIGEHDRDAGIQDLTTYASWVERHLKESSPFHKFEIPTSELPDLSYAEWRRWEGGQTRKPRSLW